LGSYIINLILKEGGQVVVLARSNDESFNGISGITFVQGSILDYESLRDIAKKYHFSGIFHLAGIVEHSRKNPSEMFRVHIDGTLKILNLAKEFGIKRVVYSSTSGTVGCFNDPRSVGIDENVPKENENETSEYAHAMTRDWPYYNSKIQAEKLAREFCIKNGKPELIVMRPSLILGPGDKRMSSITLIHEFLRKNIPIVPSGGVTFVDVRDTASMFLTAMSKGKPGQTYLLASANLTHSELYRKLSEISGIKAPFLKIPGFIILFVLKILYFFTYRLFGIWIKEKDPVWCEMGSVYWTVNSKAATRDLNFNPINHMTTLTDTINYLRSINKY